MGCATLWPWTGRQGSAYVRKKREIGKSRSPPSIVVLTTHNPQFVPGNFRILYSTRQRNRVECAPVSESTSCSSLRPARAADRVVPECSRQAVSSGPSRPWTSPTTPVATRQRHWETHGRGRCTWLFGVVGAARIPPIQFPALGESWAGSSPDGRAIACPSTAHSIVPPPRLVSSAQRPTRAARTL